MDVNMLMQDFDFMSELPPLEAFDSILWYVDRAVPLSLCAHQCFRVSFLSLLAQRPRTHTHCANSGCDAPCDQYANTEVSHIGLRIDLLNKHVDDLRGWL